MQWYYGNVRIIVYAYGSSEAAIIARLQPLDDETVLQYFGTESATYKVTAKVVGLTNLNTLLGFKSTKTTQVLKNQLSEVVIGPETIILNLALRSISYTMDTTIYQTIDTAQACEIPVFTVEMELYADV